MDDHPGQRANDNEAEADAIVETIDKKFLALAAQPNMGRRREDLAERLRALGTPAGGTGRQRGRSDFRR